jgi:NTE family protein
MKMGFLASVLACAALAACAADPMNKPLADLPPLRATPSISTGGYRPAALASDTSSREVVVLLAFSGGGKRAAAFSYGVLRGLRDFRVTVDGRDQRLIDDLDTIAAASGGSFPAAYYGLHRDKIFTDFEGDFLKRDVEAYVWGIYLLPWKWEWRTYEADPAASDCPISTGGGNTSTGGANTAQAIMYLIEGLCMLDATYSTNSSAAMERVYDELMFHGATYADLIRNGKPFISINATDISYGTEFAFSQDMLDFICSDLSTFPVARAVTASNGHPALFAPITIENYAEECAGRTRGWLKRAKDSGNLSRERYLAELGKRYLDRSKTRYVHLMDGAIADDLAMRYMLETNLRYGDDFDAIHRAGLDRLRRIVLISADAQASPNAPGGRYDYPIDPNWRQQAAVHSLVPLIGAVLGTQKEAYNSETLALAQNELNDFVDRLRRLRCEQGPSIDGHSCEDVEGYFVHLSLADMPEAKMREELERIPTALTIPDEAVDKLVSAGETLVRESPVLAELRRSLEAPPQASASSSP